MRVEHAAAAVLEARGEQASHAVEGVGDVGTAGKGEFLDEGATRGRLPYVGVFVSEGPGGTTDLPEPGDAINLSLSPSAALRLKKLGLANASSFQLFATSIDQEWRLVAHGRIHPRPFPPSAPQFALERQLSNPFVD